MAFARRKGRNLNRIDLLQKRKPDRITPVKLGSTRQRHSKNTFVNRENALFISFPITSCQADSRETWGFGAKDRASEIPILPGGTPAQTCCNCAVFIRLGSTPAGLRRGCVADLIRW